MTMIVLWLASIIFAAYLAVQKKQSVVLFVLLAFIIGPLAVFILLLLPSREQQPLVRAGTPNLQSADGQRRELLQVKLILKRIQERIDLLERAMDQVAPQQSPEVPLAEGNSPEPTSQSKPHGHVKTVKPVDLEISFGRNWLSKIGIVVFTLGIVFLIGYTFRYFGPAIKIIFGFVVSVLFFYCGKKLERHERFVHFGRVVWGGGWAIAYFTTYAMHHFDSCRLMASPWMNLVLLSLLVIGLLIYVLKYRSEDMMSIALCAAYVAATMGQVTSFTLLSCLLLGGMVLFLVYQFQWIKTLALSMVFTYGIHRLWVAPNIANLVHSSGDILWWTVSSGQFARTLNFAFLSAYALIFLIAAHIARTEENPDHQNSVAALSFANVTIFSLMAFPLINQLFFTQRFIIIMLTGAGLVGLALMMKTAGRDYLYRSDLIAGLLMMTFVLPLKFVAHSWILIWLIEIPFVLLIGLKFKDRIYCYLSYGLSAWLVFQFLDFDSWGMMNVLWMTVKAKDFILFCAGMSMMSCFYLLRYHQDPKDRKELDAGFELLFSGAGCYYWTALLILILKNPWISTGLFAEGLGFLLLGLCFSIRQFRVYAYIVLSLAAFYFLDQRYSYIAPGIKWSIITINSLLFLGCYSTVKYFRRFIPRLEISLSELRILFSAVLLVIVMILFKDCPARAISLFLGIYGVLFVLAGVLTKDKTERLGGLIVLGITLCRVALVDLSGLDVIYKIITFIVLGLLFLGTSFLYNRFESED